MDKKVRTFQVPEHLQPTRDDKGSLVFSENGRLAVQQLAVIFIKETSAYTFPRCAGYLTVLRPTVHPSELLRSGDPPKPTAPTSAQIWPVGPRNLPLHAVDHLCAQEGVCYSPLDLQYGVVLLDFDFLCLRKST